MVPRHVIGDLERPAKSPSAPQFSIHQSAQSPISIVTRICCTTLCSSRSPSESKPVLVPPDRLKQRLLEPLIELVLVSQASLTPDWITAVVLLNQTPVEFNPMAPHIHQHQYHLAWDNSIAPVARIASGETVTFNCLDASNGQVTPETTAQDLLSFDMSRLDQVNGPIYIEGAAPGDVLEVLFEEISLACDWGWTGIIPDFGLLSDRFPQPHLKIWKLDRTSMTAKFNDHITLPLRPFCGEIGLARGIPGAFSTIPPYRTGGNLDTRYAVAGSRVYLPVECEGGLFSIGDGHAAQGDGEVCGTAIETSVDVRVRLTVRKSTSLTSATVHGPNMSTPPIPPTGDRGYHITLGIEPTLEAATRNATLAMIAYLGAGFGLSESEAYMLCSTAVELKVACCVDMPNYCVSAHLPLSIFSPAALEKAAALDHQ
ncbi:hypothetical protein PYCC9005_002070 [Savitreella phatthalungensis]